MAFPYLFFKVYFVQRNGWFILNGADEPWNLCCFKGIFQKDSDTKNQGINLDFNVHPSQLFTFLAFDLGVPFWTISFKEEENKEYRCDVTQGCEYNFRVLTSFCSIRQLVFCLKDTLFFEGIVKYVWWDLGKE